MTVFIYSLEHPITHEIRYVGKTRNLKERFKNHLNKLHNEATHKRNWITKLRKDGFKPLLQILDEVDEKDWHFWEKYWIDQIRQWGFNLVNHTSGGDGLTSGNQTSFVKGFKPWNYGTAKIMIKNCEICKKDFTSLPVANRKVCSQRCKSKLLSLNKNKGMFTTESISWNKGKSGYNLSGLKSQRSVEQYDLQGNYIKTFTGCNEAAKEMNCIAENIRRCCVGKSKTAKGFVFKYKI